MGYRYASKVAQTLALRNTYIDEPYFCSLLLLPVGNGYEQKPPNLLHAASMTYSP